MKTLSEEDESMSAGDTNDSESDATVSGKKEVNRTPPPP